MPVSGSRRPFEPRCGLIVRFLQVVEGGVGPGLQAVPAVLTCRFDLRDALVGRRLFLAQLIDLRIQLCLRVASGLIRFRLEVVDMLIDLIQR